MIRTRKAADGTTRYLVRVGTSPARTFTRKKDAEEYEAELIRARRRSRAGLDQTRPDITYGSLVSLYEDAFSPSAWRKDMLAYSTERWEKVYVRQIQPEALGSWLANLQGRSDKPLSEKTKAHIVESMRQVLNAGVDWGYLQKSPARRGMFKVPSQYSRVRPIRPFESWDEVLLVADACAAQYKVAGPLVRFVCATGLRPNEWLGLLWAHIDREGKIMRVGSKTAAGHRTVPLSKQAFAALDELPRSIYGYVFPSRRGTRFNYKRWRRVEWPLALETAGLDHRTPYEMRHTFATLALAQGAAIDDVATVMGHEDITVVYRYYRKWVTPMADRLRLTLDQIGAEDDLRRDAHGDG